MTAKALQKKIASIGLHEDKDIEKSNPSRRAREKADATSEIQLGINNPIDPSIADESGRYDSDKMIYKAGVVSGLIDPEWVKEFESFVDMSHADQRRYLDGDFS